MATVNAMTAAIKEDQEAADPEKVVPAVAIDDASDDEATKKKIYRQECMGLLKILGTNSAMIAAVALYCALGGLIFSTIEVPYEIQTCKDTRAVYEKKLEETALQIDFLSSNLQLSDGERSELYSEAMENLRIGYQDSGWDSRDCETMVPNWNWLGSFFFCLTIVSTIGYGNISPNTMLGRFIVSYLFKLDF